MQQDLYCSVPLVLTKDLQVPSVLHREGTELHRWGAELPI